MVGSSHFEQGVRAYNAQSWTQAEAEFQAALQENGTDTRVQGYIERTRLAITDQEVLNRARSLRDQADLTGAFNAASGVSNAQSPLLQEARTLQTQIRIQQAGLAVAQGQRELEAGHLEEARNQLELARGMNAQASVVRTLEQAIARASGEAPGADPVEEPAVEEPTEEPAEEPTEEPAEEPGEEPAEEPGGQGTRSSRRTSHSSHRSGRGRPRAIPTSVGRSSRGGGSDSLTGRIVSTYLSGNFEGAANMARIGADAASGRWGFERRTQTPPALLWHEGGTGGQR
jgi:hypothetical protein